MNVELLHAAHLSLQATMSIIEAALNESETHSVHINVARGPDCAKTDVPKETKFYELVALLNDDRYALRSVASLTEKLGVTANELFATLDAESIDYVTRTRRSDGAQMIGLTERN